MSVLIAGAVAGAAVFASRSDPPADQNIQSQLEAAELPPIQQPTKLKPEISEATPTPNLDIPASGNGMFISAPGTTQATLPTNVTAYRVEVEQGLPWKPSEVATKIDDTLADPRGWNGSGHGFQRSTDANLRILVATPTTVDRLCAPLLTRGELSCRNGDRVVLNARRWALGIDDYDKLDEYRTYLINHEVGHALGHGHETCPVAGAPAPVMQQQTKGLQQCRTNPWPTQEEIIGDR